MLYFHADELIKLGITDEIRGLLYNFVEVEHLVEATILNIEAHILFFYLLAEADLRHTAIWMSGIYLMLQMQFLENRVALELTRSEYVEAQEVNLWFYFPVFVFASLHYARELIKSVCIV